jgi:hypothetical protein
MQPELGASALKHAHGVIAAAAGWLLERHHISNSWLTDALRHAYDTLYLVHIDVLCSTKFSNNVALLQMLRRPFICRRTKCLAAAAAAAVAVVAAAAAAGRL